VLPSVERKDVKHSYLLVTAPSLRPPPCGPSLDDGKASPLGWDYPGGGETPCPVPSPGDLQLSLHFRGLCPEGENWVGSGSSPRERRHPKCSTSAAAETHAHPGLLRGACLGSTDCPRAVSTVPPPYPKGHSVQDARRKSLMSCHFELRPRTSTSLLDLAKFCVSSSPPEGSLAPLPLLRPPSIRLPRRKPRRKHLQKSPRESSSLYHYHKIKDCQYHPPSQTYFFLIEWMNNETYPDSWEPAANISQYSPAAQKEAANWIRSITPGVCVSEKHIFL